MLINTKLRSKLSVNTHTKCDRSYKVRQFYYKARQSTVPAGEKTEITAQLPKINLTQSYYNCFQSRRREQLLEQKIIFQIGSHNYQGILQLIYSCFSSSCSRVLHFLQINTHTTHNTSIRSDEGLTPETSALKHFTVANLCYQLS